mgnify:CR=1 FL=1
MLFTLLLAADWVHTLDPIEAPAAGWGAFVADVDQDGVRELGSVSHGTLPVWVEASPQLPVEPHPFAEEREDRHAMLPCDLNGDGVDEVVVGMGGGKGTKAAPAVVLWREGDSWRAEQLAATKGVRMRGVSCLDLEGDGQAELYFPGHGKKNPDVFLVREAEGWVDKAPELGLDRNESTFGGLWADLDGDGDLDLVRLEDNSVSVLFQDQGAFTTAVPLDFKGVRDIALGDVDNDGDQDLYLARGGYFSDVVGDHGARLHLDAGDHDSVAWQFPETCQQPYIRAQGDFQGKPALMSVSDGRKQQQYTLNWAERYEGMPDGEGLLLWVEPTSRVVNLLALGLVGRVTVNLECKTGEGAPSLLMSDALEQPPAAERQDVLLLNEGGEFTSAPLPVADRVGTGHAQFVDVDLDGDLDLFLVTEATPGTLDNGPDLLWLNDGSGAFSPAPGWPEVQQPPIEGQFGVAADLDGDHYPELLAFNGAYPRVQAGHVQLWTNPGGSNGWVEVHALDGAATSLSATVTVKAEGVTQTRLSNPYPDFRSNGTQAQVFGVGQAARVKVVVVWPDGTRRVARWVKPGTVVELQK